MIVLSTKRYTALVAQAALVDDLTERVKDVEARNDRLLDTVLAMKADGAALPPGFGEEGFDRYTFDEIETAESGEHVEPRPVLLDDEDDPEVIVETARALGFDH